MEAAKVAAAMTTMLGAALSIARARPAMMLVAAPVLHASARRMIGFPAV